MNCWIPVGLSTRLACLFSLGDFLVGVDSLAEDFMVKRVESFEIAGANFVQGSCVE